MKHYLNLVPISAKAHRKQSRMSVICIVLAVFLVTAIFGMADMFIRSQINDTQAETGNWHISLQDIDSETAEVISVRPEVKAVSPYYTLNYQGNLGYTIDGTETSVFGSDASLINEIFSGMISEGTFPKSDAEALITENARDMQGLDIGDQIQINAPDGSRRIFTVSGFLGNAANLMSKDLYGVFLAEETFRAFYLDGATRAQADNHTIYFLQFSDTGNIQGKIADLKSQVGLSDRQISENTKLLGLLGQSTDSLMVQVYASAVILSVLVLFTGIMMITSSLNSNVAQRTEFFGLMRCVGATPGQVMRFVQKEAFAWCRFAIPIGVVSGVLVIWALCFLLRYLAPGYFAGMPVFSISVPSIAAGTVMGVLTVFLAVRPPAKKASKVSPLAAVSGNANNLRPVRKAANTKVFSVDIALGIHHAKASRKNFILMTVSFALSIILFLSFSVTVEFMNHAINPLDPWAADVSIISADNSCSVDKEFVKELEENPSVETVYGRMFAYNVPITVNGAEQKADLISYEENQFNWAEEYLKEGSAETVQNERNTGLIVYEPQNSIQVGDTVNMSINGKPEEIRIAGMLSESPFYNAADAATIICSEDTFVQLTGQSDYTIIDMRLARNATDNDVNVIHLTYGGGHLFADKRMGNESARGVYYCIGLFVYGFLVLIALITIFNVINSIALSTAARTRQYGEFRAIGLSDRQLSQMVAAEAFTYTIAGSVTGIILGTICNKILFTMLIGRNFGDTWTLPLAEMLIIVLIVLLSVVLAVRGPIKRLRNMSVVDTLSAQ